MGIPWFSLSPLSLFSHATVPRQTHSTVVATSNVAGAKTLRKGKLALCWEELWSQEHETSPHGFFLSLFSCPRDLNKGSDMEACGRTGYQRVEFLGRGPKRGALGNWKVQGRLQKGRSSGQWLCIIVYELLSHVCLDQILISILTILRTKVMRRAPPNSQFVTGSACLKWGQRAVWLHWPLNRHWNHSPQTGAWNLQTEAHQLAPAKARIPPFLVRLKQEPESHIQIFQGTTPNYWTYKER